MAAAITGVIHAVPQTIFAFRAVAVGATLGSVWFVYKLMQHVRPSKTAYAVAFIGLNPVVLFHTAGGGHVDALVMLAISAAIYLAATDRDLLATAVLTMGALVKVSAAVPLLLLIIYVAARADPRATDPRDRGQRRPRRGDLDLRGAARSCRRPTPRWGWSRSCSTHPGSRRPS